MKTMDKIAMEPRALREVWEWKEAVYQETKHLTTSGALDYILKQGREIAHQLNLPVASFPVLGAPATKAAESPAKYTPKRKR